MTLAESLAPTVIGYGVFYALTPWFDPNDPRVRRVALGASAILFVRYMIWRALETLPDFDGRFGSTSVWAFFLLEAFCFALVLDNWKGLRDTRQRTGEADAHADWWLSGTSEQPLIDVFIPTFGEGELILRKTVAAAMNLDYSRKRVWILDDGHRAWVRDLAEELGVHYLQREDNRHYKAGNLNNALAHVSALAEPPDFIAVLDADFIVRRSFLRRVLALMHEPDVAVVQTPQHFYNPDPFQHSFRSLAFWPDDQRFLFEVLLPSFDATDSALCCGTSFLVRFRHLREIGGFPTDSICEDTLMTYRLRRAAWKTVYLNEALSFGLSPESVAEYLKQRFRWCLGTMQCVASEWGPYLHEPGLLSYLKNRLILFRWPFFTFFAFVWILVPVWFLLTGVRLLDVSTASAVYYGAPLSLTSSVIGWLSGNRNAPIVSDAADILSGFSVLPAALTWLTGSKRGFQVTDKGVSRDVAVVHWDVLGWLLFLAALVLLAGSAAAGLVPSAAGWQSGSMEGNLVLGFWTARSLIVIAVAGWACVERPKPRVEERFRCNSPVVLHASRAQASGRLTEISMSGGRVEVAMELPMGEELEVLLPDFGVLRAVPVRRVSTGNYGIKWVLDWRQYGRLVALVFDPDRTEVVAERWSPARMFWAIIRRPFA